MDKTCKFIQSHKNEDVRLLALKYANEKDINIHYALTQISAWQIAQNKLPLWGQTEGIEYPIHLSMEQCSSQSTAEYKFEIVKSLCIQGNMIDLTAGFGVDCCIIGRYFKNVTAVEKNEELCRLLNHNLPLMGCKNINVINSDCETYIKELSEYKSNHFNLIFIDPARRDNHGRKIFKINDCTPDVCELNEIMLRMSDIVMIKLSPMLDLTSIESELKGIYEIHVVSLNNECKEIIVILKSELKDGVSTPNIICSNITKHDVQRFCFTRKLEADASCMFFNLDVSKNDLLFLYEPNTSIMKGGAYKIIALQYNLMKVHKNSHLYLSHNKIENFQGRKFKVIEIIQLKKEGIKKIKAYKQANLATRNFPQSVTELRKKLQLRDGGHIYMFATTMTNNLHYMIVCEK